MDISRDTVDSVLKSILSLKLNNIVSDSYINIVESIRQSRAPLNNTLLLLILLEIYRGSNKIIKLNNSINRLNKLIKSTSHNLLKSIES